MGFSTQAVSATKIKKISPSELQILWADGHETRHLAQILRGLCPCASCRDEMTGVRVILPIHIPATLEFRKIELVGRYAVHFDFSDNHGTGIYSFEYLRELCPCEICSKVRP